jgi:hypothetical protein
MSEQRYTFTQDENEPDFKNIWRDGTRIRSTVGTHSAEFLASTVVEMLNQETAPLLARIAELEAALEANKRSSFIVWDTTIHEMRGKLQSIHSTATHALKKAGGNE